MDDAAGMISTPVYERDAFVDRDWRVPTDFLPEGQDDPWLRSGNPTEPELFPLPIGYP